MNFDADRLGGVDDIFTGRETDSLAAGTLAGATFALLPRGGFCDGLTLATRTVALGLGAGTLDGIRSTSPVLIV
jgi:uncharacterized membrane protein (UPF0136 family)